MCPYLCKFVCNFEIWKPKKKKKIKLHFLFLAEKDSKWYPLYIFSLSYQDDDNVESELVFIIELLVFIIP